MGVQGLRRFIDGNACTSQVYVNGSGTSEAVAMNERSSAGSVTAVVPSAHHVLVDMNGVIHSCYHRKQEAGRELCRAVLERLRELLTAVVCPSRSLTLCFDGPAPLAKLATQRLRRRKLAHMDLKNNKEFSDLCITAGSVFMIELENAIAKALQQAPWASFPIYFHGSAVPGEGEAKISRALSFLAASRSLTYCADDVVVVLGNDIDLALTLLGCTWYHNLFVVGSSSLQIISIGDLMYRWLLPSSSFLQDVMCLGSARIDLVFLFLLNGGDHYVGLGEVAVDLWKRYRMLKASAPHRQIVAPDLMTVDQELLADILMVAEYTGHADASIGHELLQAALWSTYTTVTGVCPNYYYLPTFTAPTLAHVRAALCERRHVQLRFGKSGGGRGRRNSVAGDGQLPLLPLAAYTAAMPTLETLPSSIQAAVRRVPSLGIQLQSADPDAVANGAAALVQYALEHELLSITEKYLCQFAEPVQINIVPPTRRLSRHEQHREISGRLRSASKGSAAPDTSRTPQCLVERIVMPENLSDVTNVPYRRRFLTFLNPFDPRAKERKVAVDPAWLAHSINANEQRASDGGGARHDATVGARHRGRKRQRQ